jgi:hypothetical protein
MGRGSRGRGVRAMGLEDELFKAFRDGSSLGEPACRDLARWAMAAVRVRLGPAVAACREALDHAGGGEAGAAGMEAALKAALAALEAEIGAGADAPAAGADR